MRKPLDGCLVVDMTTFVAAPTAARLLADLGARVIKVEPPAGDAWRSNGISLGREQFTPEENPIFDLYNTGKDMVCLNLKEKAGMEAMLRLLDKADVFITNNRPAALERLGLDYETLHKKYPGLIYGIVRGYGTKGPDADMKAFDTTAFWARTGFLRDQAIVMPDGQYLPVNHPSSVGDSYTGSVLALQILAAMLQKQQTGEGQLVSASLYHVGMFAMATMIVKQQHQKSQVLPNTRAEVNPGAGGFECADGQWIFLNCDRSVIYTLAGRPELCEDERLVGLNWRENKEFFYQTMCQCIRTKTRQEWLEALQPYDTATVPLNHFADAAADPQAWANDFIRNVAYPTGYTHRVPTSPLEMEHLTLPELDITKSIGQDTEKVLLEFGYNQGEIAEMKNSGAIV